MNSQAQEEANRQWPNHTYARGQFLKGAAWQAEQPIVVSAEQREKVIAWIASIMGGRPLEQGMAADAILQFLKITVEA